jgi:hypothetical protein
LFYLGYLSLEIVGVVGISYGLYYIMYGGHFVWGLICFISGCTVHAYAFAHLIERLTRPEVMVAQKKTVDKP